MSERSRVAVIGSGIAGLAAAWTLQRDDALDVHVLESASYVGGHTRTVDVRGASRAGGDLPVDMGFIVHNRETYPLLCGLLDELAVDVVDTEMSFAVTCRGCGLEYAGRALGAQLPGIVRPRMLRMGLGIRRFWRDAREILDGPGIVELDQRGTTLQQLAAQRGWSRDMTAHYLVPLTAAIWSTAPAGVLDFPAAYALRFFDNHRLLQLHGVQWRTIRGGSRTYVDAMLEQARLSVHAGRPVRAVEGGPDGVHVTDAAGRIERFDHVVIATHADDALRLIAAPSAAQRSVLGSFEFTSSEAVLHRDPALLPRRPEVRSSWNYQLPSCSMRDERPTMTYSMNRLQDLDTDEIMAVTLNRSADIDPELVDHVEQFSHPRYTARTLDGQRRLTDIQGEGGIFLAGAWARHGFHEDGMWSGVMAARALAEHASRRPAVVS